MGAPTPNGGNIAPPGFKRETPIKPENKVWGKIPNPKKRGEKSPR